MKSRASVGHSDGTIALALLSALAAVGVLPQPTRAADRKFLVMLADTGIKQLRPCFDDSDCSDLGSGSDCAPAFIDPAFFGVPGNVITGACVIPCDSDDDCDDFDPRFVCGYIQDRLIFRVCRAPLPNPEAIDREYFDDNPLNTTDSFAEYFHEISYGDVTVSGQVADWVLLRWRIGIETAVEDDPRDINPIIPRPSFVSPLDDGRSTGTSGEPFDNRFRMVGRSINRPGDPSIETGGRQHTATGQRVFTPGERFLDLDGDFAWDGLDERNNATDFAVNATDSDPPDYTAVDGRPDLLGPWIDLNGDDQARNETNCIYLRDSDNDGNPDCCPNGAGQEGCNGLGGTVPDLEDFACAPTNWTSRAGAIIDCNGNLRDDADDLAFGRSFDRLPVVVQGDTCDDFRGDGILDECQFFDDPFTACVAAEPSNCEDPENADPCCGAPVCTPRDRTTRPRCEFDDANGNRVMDVPEPFENFLDGVQNNPVSGYDQYIRDNFPGTDPDSVIAQRIDRPLGGPHDPFAKIASPFGQTCADGNPYRIVDFQTDVCPAGLHSEYDAPDQWFEFDSTKMEITGVVGITPQPSWYVQAWHDRYGQNTTPPDWDIFARNARLVPRTLIAEAFNANRGGPALDGVPPEDAELDDAFVLPDQLLQALDPEEPLIFYDGPVEFDDVPSSKYHRAGDGRLGEATSPFSGNIYGQDRGQNIPDALTDPDGIIVAAGPYATGVHGQHGHDAGNVLQFELQTWRREPPFNNADIWEDLHGSHPYAGIVGGNLGFRDYNLDGRIDTGFVAPISSDNYTDGRYPWSKERLVEDVIEVLDASIDFDDFADPIANDRMLCPAFGPLSRTLPPPFTDDGSVNIFGAGSGVVLMPIQAAPLPPNERVIYLPTDHPVFRPIHNEDGLTDSAYATSIFPKPPRNPQLSWNIRFPDLVLRLDQGHECDPLTPPPDRFQTPLVAHEYLHAWEDFPDLHDYDACDGSGTENCSMGEWDIMSQGRSARAGLVHPNPALKERPCTDWVEPIDLTTVLTPGVTASVTLPAAEFVRDGGYYFLENEDRPGRTDLLGNYIPGERFYFWSAGSGFDERMSGAGMLVLHEDANSSNSDAIALQQRSGARPAYRVVQADGLDELRACVLNTPVFGSGTSDAGDPFPGATDQTTFDCNSTPAGEWYTDSACTGLEVQDVILDGNGATRVSLNWTPTSIPSLRFVDPPGGVSVGNPPSATFNVRADANDVHGGTWIRFFYTTNETVTPSSTNSTFIQITRKSTPGNIPVSANWRLRDGTTGSALPDGRYFLFADLIPSAGIDGDEKKFSIPRAGRNNQGTATLEVLNADVLTSTVNSSGVVTRSGTARSETWVLRCVNSTTGEWIVNSSLTHPAPAQGTPGPDPSPRATVGTKFISTAGGVSFTLRGVGTGSFSKGAVGDTFSFTTTGITALSEAVTIRSGQVKEDPTAVIDATPLSGQPPLTVTFDARRSIEPNGQPLNFRWTWGDGSPPETGSQKTHTYTTAGTFTVVLRATNPANTRFGESAVDIQVTNNTPNAVVRATPLSGPVPLVVQFSGSQSSDTETSADQLIYQWDFGDGASANDQAQVGILRDANHTYARVNSSSDTTNCTTACPCTSTGRVCSVACPCSFNATLTVTDSGGKTDTDAVVVRVGNTNPLASVSTTALSGPGPLTVTFNARNSTDAENDIVEVEWNWGDGTPNETFRAKVGKPPANDGSVPHAFSLPAGATTKTYNVRAILRDLDTAGVRKGGETNWPGVTVTVNTLSAGESDPRAIFCFVVGTACETNPPAVVAGGSVVVDASRSFDNPPGGRIASYSWDWGDGKPFSTGVTQTHAYTAAGRYTIGLTVTDGDTPAHTGRTQRTVIVSAEGGGPGDVNHAPIASFVVTPTEGFVNQAFDFDARASRDPDGDALQYRWSFGDRAATAFSANARTTHTYTAPGTYVVRLTVRDAFNASTDVIQTVRVLTEGQNRSPVAMIATGLRSGPAPLTLTFDGRLSFDPDGNPLTFTWAFHNGDVLADTLVGSVVTRVFAEAGEFTVTLTVSDAAGGANSTEPAIIRVTEPGAEPPPEPPPPRPNTGEPPDSSSGRPTPRVCGLGILTGLLGSLLGFTLTLVARQRQRHLRR